MNTFEKWQIVLTATTLAVGVVIGWYQIKINSRLASIEDYVSIAASPDGDKIKLLNTGKINIYLWGFDMQGNIQRFNKPRLIAANTLDASYYWIDPPPDLESLDGKEFEFKLYLQDEFDKKWVSEAGGNINKIQQKKGDTNPPTYQIVVWSYKTYQQDWNLK